MTGRPPSGHVLLLLDGDPPTRAGLDAAWPGWDEGTRWIVAADGGARLADHLDLAIDAWVGDGDSLGSAGVEALRRAGIPVDLAPVEKDATDAELGLLAALGVPGVRRISILGALGGRRVDHQLANVTLLGHPAIGGVEVAIVDPAGRIRLVRAPGREGAAVDVDLSGRTGDTVSLVPLDDVAGVTTAGLQFPLRGEDLPAGPARGVSNVRVAADARLTVRGGHLLVLEVPATLPG